MLKRITTSMMIVAVLAVLAPSRPAAAAPLADGGFSLIATAKTGTSSWDGTRSCAWSPAWSTSTAPQGYVINEKTVQIERLADRGTDLDQKIEYRNYVPLMPSVPDIKFPRTIDIIAYACSSRGSFGGSGLLQIRVTGSYVKIGG